jgi:hypothetical protein
MKSIGRIAVATAALMLVGATLGGTIGVVLLAALGLLVDGPGGFPYAWDAIYVSGIVGAFIGGVGGPVLTWTLLRHIPFWRIFLETTAGTSIGGALGLLLSGLNPVIAVGGALAGFVTSAIALRVRIRPRSKSVESPHELPSIEE